MSSSSRISKWESSLKSMQRSRGTDSGKSNKVKQFSDGLDLMKRMSDEDRRKKREREKAEIIMHLIFWGPK